MEGFSVLGWSPVGFCWPGQFCLVWGPEGSSKEAPTFPDSGFPRPTHQDSTAGNPSEGLLGVKGGETRLLLENVRIASSVGFVYVGVTLSLHESPQTHRRFFDRLYRSTSEAALDLQIAQKLGSVFLQMVDPRVGTTCSLGPIGLCLWCLARRHG